MRRVVCDVNLDCCKPWRFEGLSATLSSWSWWRREPNVWWRRSRGRGRSDRPSGRAPFATAWSLRHTKCRRAEATTWSRSFRRFRPERGRKSCCKTPNPTSNPTLNSMSRSQNIPSRRFAGPLNLLQNQLTSGEVFSDKFFFLLFNNKINLNIKT